MNVINAFATPIAVVKNPDAASMNPAIHEVIKRMAREQPSHDVQRAHVGGWYSGAGFFKRDELEVAALRTFAIDALRRYLADVVSEEFSQRARFSLVTWAALTQPGEYQPPHVHAGTQVSGVYYVNVPKRPRPEGMLELITPVGEQEMSFFSREGQTSVRVQPEDGTLVLFPSYLRHYTHPFKEGADRSLVVFTANCP